MFQHPRALVFHGDWRELNLPPDSVDVVLTDPPYTEHVHGNYRSAAKQSTANASGQRGIAGVVEKTFDFEQLTAFDHVPALLTVAKRWVLCFCALEQLGDYQRAAGGPRTSKGGGYVRSGIWRKLGAAPQLSGDRPANACEGWALMHRPGGKMMWNGRGMHAFHDQTRSPGEMRQGCAAANELEEQIAFLQGREPAFVDHAKAHQRETIGARHPAQKPAGLCAQLAAWFVNEGDTVLDPYAGSGALGWAALERGASIVLVDQDLQWAQHCAAEAARRLG